MEKRLGHGKSDILCIDAPLDLDKMMLHGA